MKANLQINPPANPLANSADGQAWDVFGPLVMCQGPYRVIYADPPWETPNRRVNGGTHYPLMDNKDIVNLPVGQLTNCAAYLFLWVTWTNFKWTLQVIENWGFKYQTGMPWVKMTKGGKPWIGLGGLVRECSELLIIAKRGHPDSPPKSAYRPGVVLAPRGRVSAKPEEVARWIELAVPDGPRIELFARRPRPGWVVWGNEVEPG